MNTMSLISWYETIDTSRHRPECSSQVKYDERR